MNKAFSVAVPLCVSNTQYYINTVYCEYLKKYGYTPTLITKENLNSVEADGLLLPGGKDINPLNYNQPNTSSFKVNQEEDLLFDKLLEIFIEKKKPIFAICKGMQMVAYKYLLKHGQILQHIENHDQAELSLKRNLAFHLVKLNPKEDISLHPKAIKSTTTLQVNSLHHQGFVFSSTEDLQTNFKILAYANGNEHHPTIAEALTYKTAFCVQWHPEEMDDGWLLNFAFKGFK